MPPRILGPQIRQGPGKALRSVAEAEVLCFHLDGLGSDAVSEPCVQAEILRIEMKIELFVEPEAESSYE